MAKYVIGENKEVFDIEDALTITKGEWADENPDGQNRLYRFVTANSDWNKVTLANANSYICGVTVKNDSFLGSDQHDTKYCVVQSLGICQVEDDGTLIVGNKCMPSNDGKAVKSSNNLGYRVIGRVDDTHVQIIMSPNNDMVQRIKEETQTKLGQGTYTGKLDDINPKESSIYWCNNCPDRPSQISTYGWCITLSSGGGCVQIYRPYHNTLVNRLHIRNYINNQWYNWSSLGTAWVDITNLCTFPSGLWSTTPSVLTDGHQIIVNFASQFAKDVSGVSTLLTLPSGISLPRPQHSTVMYYNVPTLVRTSGTSTISIVFNATQGVTKDRYLIGQIIVPIQ